jgi:hypothetical protein
MLKGTKILIVLFLLFWDNVSFSQQLSHQVLVPAAGQAVSGTLNYSQTVGETAIEIISSSGFVFTQGFQQPGIKLNPGEMPSGNGVEVYPNPVTDNLTIKLFGDISREFNIQIISITGTIAISEKLSFINNYFIEKVIPVGQLNKGIYLVRVISSDKLISRIFKIEKM